MSPFIIWCLIGNFLGFLVAIWAIPDPIIYKEISPERAVEILTMGGELE